MLSEEKNLCSDLNNNCCINNDKNQTVVLNLVVC